MKKWMIPLISLTLALAVAGIFAGFTLSGGSGSPAQDPTATSIDDIDPKVCNAIHNINACTPEELEELGIGPYPRGDEQDPTATSIDDIDPKVCNAIHNINACTPEELEELGIAPAHGDPEPPEIADGTDVPGTPPVIEPMGPSEGSGELVAEPTKYHNDDTGVVDYGDAEVKLTGEVVSEGIFSVDGRILEVNGERVLVMDYGDADALDAEAAGISPDGSSVGTHMVTWVGPPRFFRTETAIVLYVGESPTVIEALTEMMGPPFAGR